MVCLPVKGTHLAGRGIVVATVDSSGGSSGGISGGSSGGSLGEGGGDRTYEMM